MRHSLQPEVALIESCDRKTTVARARRMNSRKMMTDDVAHITERIALASTTDCITNGAVVVKLNNGRSAGQR